MPLRPHSPRTFFLHNSQTLPSAGDFEHLHPHLSPCVLPAGGGDHPAYLPRGAAARQVPHLRYDPRLHQVSQKEPSRAYFQVPIGMGRA